jgi:hypothetical protein
MSKSSKNKHYALSQMKELRKEFMYMKELGEKNHKALMAHKSKLREQRALEGMDEWEQIKHQSKQLRLL